MRVTTKKLGEDEDKRKQKARDTNKRLAEQARKDKAAKVAANKASETRQVGTKKEFTAEQGLDTAAGALGGLSGKSVSALREKRLKDQPL